MDVEMENVLLQTNVYATKDGPGFRVLNKLLNVHSATPPLTVKIVLTVLHLSVTLCVYMETVQLVDVAVNLDGLGPHVKKR